ncbi:MAG: PIN domain-containing protein [Candidatus Dormiibacterota bacterium]
MPPYAVVLDACVLVPITVADTLLRIAERGLFRPIWSDRIVAEAIDAIRAVHADVPADAIRRRFASMNETFEDARVTGWEDLELGVELPDADDRHVVAVALRGRADAIVTANFRDYPVGAVGPLGIAVTNPDDFLLDQLDLAPGIVLDVLREQAAHTRNPPLRPGDLIARLSRAGVSRFAAEAGRLL